MTYDYGRKMTYSGLAFTLCISLSFRDAKPDEGVTGVLADITISRFSTGHEVSSFALKVENAPSGVKYEQGAFYNLYYNQVFGITQKKEEKSHNKHSYDPLVTTFSNLTKLATILPP